MGVITLCTKNCLRWLFCLFISVHYEGFDQVFTGERKLKTIMLHIIIIIIIIIIMVTIII